MTLVRFQPAPFQHLLTEFWNTPTTQEKSAQPVVNILETASGFRLEIAAPGFARDNFKIQLEKDLLTISANLEANPANDTVKYFRREFVPGSFERSFRVPASIDPENVNARFDNGILYVDLVKKPELQPVTKAIEVQ